MSKQYEEFLNILRAMEEEGVDYILVGGFAVVLHGMHRHTMDIDIFVRNERQNIENLQKALDSLYHDPAIKEISYQELKEYPVIRYGTPQGTALDIMTRQGEAIAYEDLDFEAMEIDGQIIRVATPEALLKMKANTMRPSDKQDVIFCQHLISNRIEKEQVSEQESEEDDYAGPKI